MVIADIVFKFGNFYSEADSSGWFSFFKQILGSLIGAGVSLFLFYKKQKSDSDELENKKRLEKEKQENEKKEVEKQWNGYIGLLSKKIESVITAHIKSLEDFIANLKSHPYSISFFQFIASNDLDRLVNKINQQELYNFWIERFGNESKMEFRQLYSYLDYFEFELKHSWTSFESYKAIQYESQKNFSESYDKIRMELYTARNEYQQLLGKGVKTDNSADNLNLINKIIALIEERGKSKSENFNQTGDELKIIFDDFIHPLLDNLRFSTNTPEDPLNNRNYLKDNLALSAKYISSIKTQTEVQVLELERHKKDLEKLLEKYSLILKRFEE